MWPWHLASPCRAPGWRGSQWLTRGVAMAASSLEGREKQPPPNLKKAAGKHLKEKQVELERMDI